jgi:MFS family permease
MRRLLFPLGLGTALSLMGDATLYAVLPTHMAEAGVTLAGVGVLLGVNRAVRLFLNGPAGLAYDRRPRRPLFVGALFIGALSTALYAATYGFWPLFVARLLWGLAWSGIWVGGATMILDGAAPAERGRWTGFYQTWFFVGSALGSLGGGLLTDLLGYTATMWVGAAVTAAGGLVALLMLPETGHRPVSTTAACPSIAAPRRSLWRLRSRENRELWLAIALQGVNRFIVSGVISGTLALVVQAWAGGMSVALGVATLTGVAMAARTLLSMAAAPLAGAWSDRARAAQGSRWPIVGGSLVAGAVGMALLAAEGALPLIFGMAAVAVAGGGVQSLATVLIGDVVRPPERGRAIGLLHTAGDFGSAIGPSIAYVLLPLIGLRAVYLLCAALFLLGLVPVWQACRRAQSEPQET